MSPFHFHRLKTIHHFLISNWTILYNSFWNCTHTLSRKEGRSRWLTFFSLRIKTPTNVKSFLLLRFAAFGGCLIIVSPFKVIAINAFYRIGRGPIITPKNGVCPRESCPWQKVFTGFVPGYARTSIRGAKKKGSLRVRG